MVITETNLQEGKAKISSLSIHPSFSEVVLKKLTLTKVEGKVVKFSSFDTQSPNCDLSTKTSLYTLKENI